MGIKGLRILLVIVVLAIASLGVKYFVEEEILQVKHAMYPLKYMDSVEKYAEEFGVDKYLILAVIKTESGFDPIGITLSLTCVSKIRGFSGVAFTDLVYDEFIPESHVNRIRNEGDAFLNAVVTISGNREIEGKPPLRCWLLANSNNIGSPILKALNITDKVESMDKSGQELSILPDRGIIIVLAKARELADKRKKTSLMKAISKESEFTKMAYDNEFSYNDAENVTRRDLKQYQQIAAVTGVFTIWKHKGNGSLYITSYRRCTREFSNTDRGYRELLTTIPTLKLNYTFNNTYFESLAVKETYKDIVRL